nr:subtilisin-like protease SBT1.4 [Malus domestica]
MYMFTNRHSHFTSWFSQTHTLSLSPPVSLVSLSLLPLFLQITLSPVFSCEITPDFPSGSWNRKLIAARHFASSAITRGVFNSSLDYASPFDGDGHGTHTASIAAGNHGILVVFAGHQFYREVRRHSKEDTTMSSRCFIAGMEDAVTAFAYLLLIATSYIPTGYLCINVLLLNNVGLHIPQVYYQV